MPAFFLFVCFSLPFQFSEALPLGRVLPFYIELPLETTRVYKFRERGIKIQCRFEPVLQTLWTSARVQVIKQKKKQNKNRKPAPEECLSPPQNAKQSDILSDSTLTGAIFISQSFLEKWGQVFVRARRWDLHLPPTQKNLFAYGIYATFVWHMFVCLAPRIGSLRQWVGGGTASQSLFYFFIFFFLWSGRTTNFQMASGFLFVFCFFLSSPPPP